MKFFGTDGIRKSANDFTPEFNSLVARGLVEYAGDNIKVFIAGDTRESSEWLIKDFETAFESLGIEYASAGILPTPAINYCFYKMGFDFAIDITASHNPYTDNGIKIFERGKKSGKKLSLEGCEIIEKTILEAKLFPLISPTARENLHSDALELYKEHLLDYLGTVNFKGLKIGLDCANGAMSVINSEIFESLGAKISLINCCKNYNTLINQDCGSTHLDSLKNLVLKNSLDFGIAFDGDGDRVLLIDKNGKTIDGDEIIAILATYLNLDSIAITIMANQGLLNWAADNDVKTEITAVGDSNVYDAMQEKNIPLGGEQSGHIILPNEPTGDGMLTALVLVKAVQESKKSLNELASVMEKFPQIIVNCPATPEGKQSFKEKPEIKTLLLDYNKKLESVSGRLLVRPSGTENLIRITMWGNDEEKITIFANNLKEELERLL